MIKRSRDKDYQQRLYFNLSLCAARSNFLPAAVRFNTHVLFLQQFNEQKNKHFSILFSSGGKLFFPAVPVLWITMRLEYCVNCKEVVDVEFEHLSTLIKVTSMLSH